MNESSRGRVWRPGVFIAIALGLIAVAAVVVHRVYGLIGGAAGVLVEVAACAAIPLVLAEMAHPGAVFRCVSGAENNELPADGAGLSAALGDDLQS